jgi:exopolyphosphatase/guanosine-5'-triphosphate,3'-diphosphate pyrophosphatase
MEKIKLAAIDIGTNTILMVIGEIEANGNLSYTRNEHSIARLGEALDRTGIINPNAIERAKKILIEYKNLCDSLGVLHISAVGTAALREAMNGKEVSEKLSEIINTNIRIISGEEEAKLSFLGTIESDEPCIVVDIGGGSTELIYGQNHKVIKRYSLPIGAVKLTERFFRIQPTGKENISEAEKTIGAVLSQIDLSDFKGKLYGVAGTPTTLAAMAQNLKKYSKEKVQGYILTSDVIEHLLNRLLKCTIEEIKKINGIHPDRADIITAGTLLLKCLLTLLGKTEFTVSTQGLRYGVLKELAESIR